MQTFIWYRISDLTDKSILITHGRLKRIKDTISRCITQLLFTFYRETKHCQASSKWSSPYIRQKNIFMATGTMRFQFKFRWLVDHFLYQVLCSIQMGSKLSIISSKNGGIRETEKQWKNRLLCELKSRRNKKKRMTSHPLLIQNKVANDPIWTRKRVWRI